MDFEYSQLAGADGFAQPVPAWADDISGSVNSAPATMAITCARGNSRSRGACPVTPSCTASHRHGASSSPPDISKPRPIAL
jgi:hypothetical protein